MKIAITGGTGFVGGQFARALVAQGHHVILISRGLDHRDQSIDIVRRNHRSLPFAEELPDHLKPRIIFSKEKIARGLPEPKPFGLSDFRACYK